MTGMRLGSLPLLIALLAPALAFAAVTASAPAPLIAPATLDDTLEVNGEALKARQLETRMSVAVEVNGQGPFRFIVDSGADRSVIGSALAERLALPAGRAVRLNGMAGSSEVPTVLLDSLGLGQSRVPGIAAPALPEDYLGAQGLVGIDALAEQRLMLDFEAKTITVEDARRPEPRGGADEIIVVARRRHGQLILTQVSVGRQQLSAVIDTGSEATMGNSALRARVFAGRHPPVPLKIELISVTGERVQADLVILPLVTIGGLTLQNVPVAFADAPPFRLFGLDREPAMLLGTDLLGTFRRVSLDFGRRRVRFVLRERDRDRRSGPAIVTAYSASRFERAN